MESGDRVREETVRLATAHLTSENTVSPPAKELSKESIHSSRPESHCWDVRELVWSPCKDSAAQLWTRPHPGMNARDRLDLLLHWDAQTSLQSK
jgi:hypothetical protein